MLARVLRRPGCRVHSVNLARQQIGADGTAKLEFEAKPLVESELVAE